MAAELYKTWKIHVKCEKWIIFEKKVSNCESKMWIRLAIILNRLWYNLGKIIHLRISTI